MPIVYGVRICGWFKLRFDELVLEWKVALISRVRLGHVP